jgi:ataxia telangiectasia mutated family protein
MFGQVQLGFAAVLEAVQNLLSAFLGQAPTTATSSLDKDFEFTLRSGPSITLEKEKNAVLPSRWRRSHIQLMLAVLTVVPVMQLANPEFIRDRDLFDAFVNCEDHHFLNHADLYFRNFRQHYISLSSSQFNSLLERFESLLIQYPHSRSEYIQILLIKFLDYTMPYWLQPSVMSSETGGKTRELCHWLAQMLNGQKIRSWKTRDRLCQFLHRYVELDPFQNFWRPPQSFSSRRSQDDDVSMDESSSELPNDFFPCFIIPRLGSDDDIRVRFRVATISPRLLATAQHMGQESMEWYEEVKKWLSQDLDRHGHLASSQIISLTIIAVMSTC